MKIPQGLYIAIEGVIGAGKTSLANILADELGVETVLENADDNPYLSKFYEDPKRWALHTQMCFLLSRNRQQFNIRQRDLFMRTVISDYVFDKDRIFARLNLDDGEFMLYQKIADILAADAPTPDRLIFLKSTQERLLTNIRIRNIPYERSITNEYLDDLSKAYNQYFLKWDQSSLLLVNADRIDFVNNADHRDKLVQAVVGMTDGVTIFDMED